MRLFVLIINRVALAKQGDNSTHKGGSECRVSRSNILQCQMSTSKWECRVEICVIKPSHFGIVDAQNSWGVPYFFGGPLAHNIFFLDASSKIFGPPPKCFGCITKHIWNNLPPIDKPLQTFLRMALSNLLNLN